MGIRWPSCACRRSGVSRAGRLRRKEVAKNRVVCYCSPRWFVKSLFLNGLEVRFAANLPAARPTQRAEWLECRSSKSFYFSEVAGLAAFWDSRRFLESRRSATRGRCGSGRCNHLIFKLLAGRKGPVIEYHPRLQTRLAEIPAFWRTAQVGSC